MAHLEPLGVLFPQHLQVCLHLPHHLVLLLPLGLCSLRLGVQGLLQAVLVAHQPLPGGREEGKREGGREGGRKGMKLVRG